MRNLVIGLGLGLGLATIYAQAQEKQAVPAVRRVLRGEKTYEEVSPPPTPGKMRMAAKRSLVEEAVEEAEPPTSTPPSPTKPILHSRRALTPSPDSSENK
ncbi:MAG: hypothetical protein NZ958_08330 [Bacteroidia bacterium]|nr:hypothetical protein [Bacteroidia bacterium]MDW8088511.1 hypothetical protein [Bacteroidia bacterium]